jgi:hypothetical protein
MPALTLLVWATILLELLGGFAVFVGAFIPLASIPMAILTLVAIFTVHLPNGFRSIKLESMTSAGAHFGQPGYETDLLYLATLLALVLGDRGHWRSIGYSSALGDWLPAIRHALLRAPSPTPFSAPMIGPRYAAIRPPRGGRVDRVSPAIMRAMYAASSPTP